MYFRVASIESIEFAVVRVEALKVARWKRHESNLDPGTRKGRAEKCVPPRISPPFVAVRPNPFKCEGGKARLRGRIRMRIRDSPQSPYTLNIEETVERFLRKSRIREAHCTFLAKHVRTLGKPEDDWKNKIFAMAEREGGARERERTARTRDWSARNRAREFWVWRLRVFWPKFRFALKSLNDCTFFSHWYFWGKISKIFV